jgi:hypothetical protein
MFAVNNRVKLDGTPRKFNLSQRPKRKGGKCQNNSSLSRGSIDSTPTFLHDYPKNFTVPFAVHSIDILSLEVDHGLARSFKIRVVVVIWPNIIR